MGCERRVVYDLINVINGEASLNQALIRDKNCNLLSILPASQTRNKDALTQDGIGKSVEELRPKILNIIVCDSPAGIETGAHLAMCVLQMMRLLSQILKYHPVRDSDRMLWFALKQIPPRGTRGYEPIKEYCYLSRYSPQRVKSGAMLSLDDVQEILSLPLLGVDSRIQISAYCV
jgi:septum site-determining protein MinD